MLLNYIQMILFFLLASIVCNSLLCLFSKLMVAGDGVEKTERISSMQDCGVAAVLSMELLGKESVVCGNKVCLKNVCID